MDESRISVRYAKALFDAALEQDMIDPVAGDMKSLEEICRLPEFRAFVDNPTIFPSRKITVLNSALADGFNKVSLLLINLAVKNGREKHFAAIARNFLDLYRKHKGITSVTLTTAHKAATETVKQVEAVVSEILNTRVEIQEQANPDLIGGFVVRIEDKLIDASVRSRLKKIEEKLMQTGHV